MKKKKCENPDCEEVVTGRGRFCSYKCAIPAIKDAADQIISKEGPVYEKWKVRLKASITNI